MTSFAQFEQQVPTPQQEAGWSRILVRGVDRNPLTFGAVPRLVGSANHGPRITGPHNLLQLKHGVTCDSMEGGGGSVGRSVLHLIGDAAERLLRQAPDANHGCRSRI